MSVAQKLISSHLVSGEMRPGCEAGLRIDQTLTQDATGTLVMLELEAMGLDRVRTELSAQYVDHNLLQADERNSDDHLFLHSAAQRFGLWFSKPGNGVSHPTHQQRFGRPGWRRYQSGRSEQLMVSPVAPNPAESCGWSQQTTPSRTGWPRLTGEGRLVQISLRDLRGLERCVHDPGCSVLNVPGR